MGDFTEKPKRTFWPTQSNFLRTERKKTDQKISTGIPRSVVLHFIALCRYCVFYKWKVCDNPASSKSIGTIFQQHLLTVYLCRVLVVLTILWTFSCYYVCYGALWLVIFDVTTVIILEAPRTLLSYFKKLPQSPQPSATTTLMS